MLAMDHSIRLSGTNFALRPITLDDAALIVELRADRERTKYMNPIATEVAAQTAYLQSYLTRPDDYYFVIESHDTGAAEGLIALYDIDNTQHRGEAGRWILRPSSLAAVESVWLIYRVAFDQLGLDEVVCLTLTDNRRALSFHDSCGLERRQVRERDVLIGDVWHDRVEHVLSRPRWPELGKKLERLASCVK